MDCCPARYDNPVSAQLTNIYTWSDLQNVNSFTWSNVRDDNPVSWHITVKAGRPCFYPPKKLELLGFLLVAILGISLFLLGDLL